MGMIIPHRVLVMRTRMYLVRRLQSKLPGRYEVVEIVWNNGEYLVRLVFFPACP